VYATAGFDRSHQSYALIMTPLQVYHGHFQKSHNNMHVIMPRLSDVGGTKISPQQI